MISGFLNKIGHFSEEELTFLKEGLEFRTLKKDQVKIIESRSSKNLSKRNLSKLKAM